MKLLEKQLERIPELSELSKKELSNKASIFIQQAGVSIDLEELNANNITLSVKYINGKRLPKHELVDFTYNTFRSRVPEKYRITIVI